MEDQNHRRLLIFGETLVLSFTAFLGLMWWHQFEVSDGILTTIIMLYVTGIGSVGMGLGARKNQTTTTTDGGSNGA